MHRALAVGMLLTVAGTAARAEPLACEREIVRQSARHAQAVMKVLAACGDAVIAGRLAPGTDCRTEPVTAARLAAAASKASAKTAIKCCGADHVCGNGDDDAVGAIGWGFGVCPDLESEPCTNAVAGAGDVAPCLTCVGGRAVDRVLALAWGPGGPAAAPAPVGPCRRALAKETSKLFIARSKALARCWDGRLAGHHANACPLPGDGKAGPAIAAAEAKASAKICAACGGADHACGGADDLTPAAIGAPAECPALTVPGGAACGGPLATLGDVTACAACVADFAGTCTDRLAVPALATYPLECNPDSPVCADGVGCADDSECPIGYTCQDNGGDTRYCVGAPCSGNAACGGGGVCRQYCTFGFGACGAPRCQCGGFGCSGPDEVCLDRGGLACNKLCTEDSDCVAPFGFVCVNAGFADGVCIGTVPCE